MYVTVTTPVEPLVLAGTVVVYVKLVAFRSGPVPPTAVLVGTYRKDVSGVVLGVP